MPIYRDKDAGCWRFEFNRVVPGAGRIRARKRLPKGWSRAEADAYDREESGRLYRVARGVEKPVAGIEQAVAIYRRERLPALKSGRGIKHDLGLIFWAYRGMPITALPEVCAKIRKEYAGKLAPATIRNRIRYLTSACRYAWKHHAICEHDPAARVSVPPVSNERQVYTDRAFMLLIAQATPCRETRAMIRIGFYSGMRVAEIRRALIEDGMFKLPDTKNGEPRWIPIHRRIRCCVGYLPFASGRSTLDGRFRQARRAVDMDHLHFHDLRHSTASEMINGGVDLYTVGAVLGHKSAQSTKRYAHMATKALGEALGQVGKKVPHPSLQKAA